MSITHIDCFFYRATDASVDTSSYVALNARQRPGSLVLAGSCAVRDSIGSQVACKLAIEHFLSGVISFTENQNSSNEEEAPPDLSLNVLEAAFKSANTSVYSFGHRLAAGGRMGASLIGLAIEESMIAAGRVGPSSAYLARKGDIFPFFESHGDSADGKASLDGFVGSQSVISVELASVPTCEGDMVYVFPVNLSIAAEKELGYLSEEFTSEIASSKTCTLPVSSGRPAPCERVVTALARHAENLDFCMLTVIGPQTIYLRDVVTPQPPEGAVITPQPP